jgi:eukaryotic-like serine/threonine-protein kinase
MPTRKTDPHRRSFNQEVQTMSRLDALSPRWSEISALLDEALALPAAERAPWIESLDGGRAVLKDTLRELLVANAGAECHDFLGTLPRLAAPPASAGEPAAGLRIGPYQLISELGHGGMGAVWLAERADGQLKRRVALKLPRMAWGTSLAQRLARERDILASLEHPHIARLYDAGVDAHGRPYFAMEFVEGQPIDVHCRERSLSVRERIELIVQVCEAVAHAHSRLVVHRDLKPGNILVTAQGEVRLLDFGIAKLIEGDRAEETALTRESGRALTLDYASPEQIAGASLGTASDVYSLGVVAYELLAGCKPYRVKRGSAAELEEAIGHIDPPRASTAATGAPLKRALRGDLDAILNKALKKNSADRYGTVEAFAQDLRRHSSQQPVLARADTLAYRAAKFTRRYRLQVTAGALVAMATLGGAGAAIWQARSAREQAREAERQADIARRETQRAQAVQGFLTDIFRANTDQQADPQRARNTTARQLLDVGAARLSSALRDAPEARASVMKTLSEMYAELNLGEPAAALATDRVQLLRQIHGNDDRQVAQALVSLASLLPGTSRRAEILPALLEAQRILDAAGDTGSRLRGDLLTRLAQRYQNISVSRMKQLADEAVRVLRPHAVPNEDRMSNALHLAGRSRMLLGELSEAQALYEQGLQELRRETPVAHVALAQHNGPYFECLMLQQKWDQALQMARDEEARLSAALGPTEPSAIAMRSRLALALHAVGDRESAWRLHQEALRQVLDVKGEADTLFTPIVRIRVAQSLIAEGRWAEALPLVDAVAAVRRQHYPDSASLASTLRTQAVVWTGLGRHAAARALFAEAWAAQQQGGEDMLPWRHNRFILDEARLDLAVGDAAAARARLARVAARPAGQGVPPMAEDLERSLLLAEASTLEGKAAEARALAGAVVDATAAGPASRGLWPLRDDALRLQARLQRAALAKSSPR